MIQNNYYGGFFYHSQYEKKDKYSIDFTLELVSGGYYIYREVGRKFVKSGVSRSDRESLNVCRVKRFVKIFIGQPLTIFAKRSIIDVTLNTPPV